MPNASYSFQQIAQTETPAAIKLRVRNAAATGSLPLDFTVLSNQSWLVVSPTSGSLASNETLELWVSANTTGLTSGTYTGLLTIADPDAVNNPFEVEFTLQIDPCDETFVVTLTACPSTIVGAESACTPAIQAEVLPCTSAIQGTDGVTCSSSISAVVIPCTSAIQGVELPCTSAIQGAESYPELDVRTDP